MKSFFSERGEFNENLSTPAVRISLFVHLVENFLPNRHRNGDFSINCKSLVLEATE